MTGFDVSEHPSQIAGQVDAVPCPPGQRPGTRSPGCTAWSSSYCWCCDAALRDAGWWERRQEVRVGLVLGIGAEWLVLWEADALRGGTRVCDPERRTPNRWSAPHRGKPGPDGPGRERVGGLRQRQLCPGPGRGAGWSWAGSTSAWPAPATWP